MLPGYEAQPGESGVDHSRRKLAAAKGNLEQVVLEESSSSSSTSSKVSIVSLPCTDEEDTWAYRCRCTFQIVIQDTDGALCYAMRHQQKPIRVDNSFPIATRRIQAAMKSLMEDVLNCNDENKRSSFEEFKRNLASITFSSAWRDEDDLSSDCIVTVNYDQPIDPVAWNESATIVCKQLKLRQLNGRSKKVLVSVKEDDCSSIRDTVWLRRNAEGKDWSVSLSKMKIGHSIKSTDTSNPVIPIHYNKPETAFYHPNSNAMCQALEWMLERLTMIASGSAQPSRLLEMYCGCGAHTCALGKTGLLDHATAIEIDQRLVDACQVNIKLNNLDKLVRVEQGDAGVWATKMYKKQVDPYDILLVDPPRAGLDQTVCNMACEGSFQHFLYISCGHKALLRDLERLSSAFKVVSIVQTDLFPRTDSIETLVHLQKK